MYLMQKLNSSVCSVQKSEVTESFPSGVSVPSPPLLQALLQSFCVKAFKTSHGIDVQGVNDYVPKSCFRSS